MAIDKDQIKVYQAISDMIWKSIYSLVIIVAFFIILCYALKADEWQNKAVLAALNFGLGGYMMFAFRHYFPNRDKKKK